MPLGVSSLQWDLRMAWGSFTQWSFNMFQPGGIVPYPPAEHTFAYVVKTNVTDADPVILLTSDGGDASPIPSGGGELAVQSSSLLTSVILTINPAATLPLGAPYQGYHALWMDYDVAGSERNLFWGQFYLDPSIQP
ncbi:MAG TPA: hypothetical protein VMU95_41370 [Trebonia sp.]|nr:hypothetical protein [Trebonia sp.]